MRYPYISGSTLAAFACGASDLMSTNIFKARFPAHLHLNSTSPSNLDLATFLSPSLLSVQLSIEEFLMNSVDPNDKDHKLLLNPLSAEFGVRTAEDMDNLVKDTLPDFKLVRACF